jgi:hypothetical protein
MLSLKDKIINELKSHIIYIKDETSNITFNAIAIDNIDSLADRLLELFNEIQSKSIQNSSKANTNN